MPRRPDDELSEFHRLAAMLAVQALDLRAEYEAKLRILTEIQRDVETLRAPAATLAARRQAVEKLRRRFNDLAAANRDASSTLKLVRREFERVRTRTRRETKPGISPATASSATMS